MLTYLKGASFIVLLLVLSASCGSGDKKADTGGKDQVTGEGVLDTVPQDGVVPSDMTGGDGQRPGDATIPEDGSPPQDGVTPSDAVTPEDAVVPADTTEPPDAVVPADTTEPPDGKVDVPAEDVEVPAAAVGPEGGEVEGPGGAKLAIPAGALTQTVEFTVTEVALPHKGSFAAAGPAIEIGPAGTKFLKPATLTLVLDKPAGQGMVSIFTAEGKDKPWLALGTSMDGQKLTASVSHLSWFQPGTAVIKSCDDLCYYLIPCMVEICGLVEPELSEMPAECIATCSQFPPVEGLIDPAKIQDCNDLITLLVPYSLTLLEVCTVEPGGCAESIQKISGCLSTECPNFAKFKTGYEQVSAMNCEKSPEAFGQMAMMSCPQIKEYLTKYDKGLANLCTNGPALSDADCTKLKQGFAKCPAEPGSPLAGASPDFLDYFFCAVGTFGLETLQCAIAVSTDCAAFWECLP
ncbi:MAG: hypothetical protein FJ109_08160 [Deltaproteobacteria bacterium]|nr:hypothetical protein [Deltaproteobacteria bacterium]